MATTNGPHTPARPEGPHKSPPLLSPPTGRHSGALGAPAAHRLPPRACSLAVALLVALFQRQPTLRAARILAHRPADARTPIAHFGPVRADTPTWVEPDGCAVLGSPRAVEATCERDISFQAGQLSEPPGESGPEGREGARAGGRWAAVQRQPDERRAQCEQAPHCFPFGLANQEQDVGKCF